MNLGLYVNRWKSLLKSWKALFFYAFGDKEKAVRELESCLKLDPKIGPNWITLGKILVSKDNYPEALEKFNEGLKYLPSDGGDLPEVFAYLAYCYYELDQLDKAIQFYRKAIGCWVKDGDFKKIDLVYGLGRIYLGQRKYKEAIDILKKGLDLKGNAALIHFGLGMAYYEVGQKEFSMDHFMTACNLDPKFRDDETMKRLKKELSSKVPVH